MFMGFKEGENMSVKTISYVHKEEVKFIGFAKTFRNGEGYDLCPKFWEEFGIRFTNLWTTMQPKNDVEKAVLENSIGMYAVCINGKKEFEYLIAGVYKGGNVPEGMKVVTYPACDWAVFSIKGPIPAALQELNTFVWKEWLPTEGVARKANPAFNVECYSMGNNQSEDYESSIWMPLKTEGK